MNNTEEKIARLSEQLNKASDAYYNGNPIMEDYEYDRLAEALSELEKASGYIPADSPTGKVGAAVNGKLPSVTHKHPALSLDKTKDVRLIVSKMEALEAKALEQDNIHGVNVMWKMDGSTIVVTYKDGVLRQIATRGNGEIGSDITRNRKLIYGFPDTLPYRCDMIVRGEAVMSYSEFDRINRAVSEEDAFANPRNLANATISAVDTESVADRRIEFFAFDLVETDMNARPEYDGWFSADASAVNFVDLDEFSGRMRLLELCGIRTVGRELCRSASELPEILEAWTAAAEHCEYPVDGLVIALDNRTFALSQPGTGHHPNIAVGYALKWKDESAETRIGGIEWSASRTGRLNPVAVFDPPVELEGTTVSRATLHNVSYILNMDLKTGDRVDVIKANKIIPAVVGNHDKEQEWLGTDNSDITPDILCRHGIPEVCPVCGGKVDVTYVTDENDNHSDSIVAFCINPGCRAKLLGKFEHFCERDCMDIDGLSEATLEKLIEKGWIKEFSDLYHLGDPENRDVLQELIGMDGFGEKSVQNMLDAIEKSRTTGFVPFVHALGIPNIGKGQAKLLQEYIVKNYPETHETAVSSPEAGTSGSVSFWDALCQLVWEGFDFTDIKGVGDVLAQSVTDYITHEVIEPKHVYGEESETLNILKEVTFTDTWPGKETSSSPLSGKTFVITGKLETYANRDELVAEIESLGGKVSGSVSKNTDYLVNNDISSTSGKNKKAKELGIEIISEADLVSMMK